MRLLVAISTLFLLFVHIQAKVEFTNVKCTALDKPFADFEYCFLKSFNRTYKYMSLKVKLHQLPITNVSMNIALLKKANGYKPFLYNFTFDACKFLKSRTNPVIGYFLGLFLEYSNMNHTCPFDNDLILEKLPVSHIDHMFTSVLPMPLGEFAVCTTWMAYGKPRAQVDLYFNLVEQSRKNN